MSIIIFHNFISLLYGDFYIYAVAVLMYLFLKLIKIFKKTKYFDIVQRCFQPNYSLTHVRL